MANNPPVEEYYNASLRITDSRGTALVVRQGAFDAIENWPFSVNQVFIITAHNPGVSLPFHPWRNALRNRKLRRVLRAQSLSHQICWGFDPRGTWPEEESFAIETGDLAQVMAIGQAFGQAAVFRLTPKSLEVLLVTES